ncbi:coiled-coil domain-containing protein [Cryptosporangium phraense]|uniref:ARB-07466-like C-terminal domain-containing protein n=1 Tax=Cryptosporangium phraense TaxID=2593070 RepID=A0A545AZP9_9ACTN|nr:hypothetical protein [Cryptosporangium phraense]TQS46806.1 hypothetical protein FL583_00560 [Cryptosporangium phraense]
MTVPRVVPALLAVLIGLGVLVGPVAPAAADDEGGTATLQQRLDEAATGYNNARAEAQASEKRRTALVSQIAVLEKRISALDAQVQELSAAAYRNGVPDAATAMANSRSLPDLIGNLGLVDTLSERRSQTLADLRQARRDLADTQKDVDAQLTKQRAAQRTMGRKRAAAEKALADAKVGGQPTGGFTDNADDHPAAAGPPARKAAPKPRRKPTAAPRRSDGTYGSEGCSQDDPTSDGCLTPRTLHALRQTRAAGFTHYVHCFRPASFGEHPKGRACDFAAAKSGFGGAATGDDRAYGNRLAAWFIANADRLGVLYVIWYRQIWLPGSGWRAYQSGSDPSAAHTNHVHLSVQ